MSTCPKCGHELSSEDHKNNTGLCTSCLRAEEREKADEPMLHRFLCRLCKAEHLTDWYFENDNIWIADCTACGGIVVVLKEHRDWTSEELLAARAQARKLFPGCAFKDGLHTLPDHPHFYVERVDDA